MDRRYIRTHLPPPERRGPLVRLLQAGNLCFVRLYHRVVVRFPVPLPARGPAIIVSNHISGLDPLLIQSLSRRKITWMMTHDFYDLPAITWLFRGTEMIRVEADGRNIPAMRQAMRALAAGRLLGVFPEGRIERSNQLLPFEPGAAMLALRTAVPIYPVCIEGTQRSRPMLQAFLQRHRVEVVFGSPLVFPPGRASREALEAATGAIQEAVGRLWQEMHCRPAPPSQSQLTA